MLGPQNIAKRLHFAKDHVNWSNEQWDKVLFTDESKFEVFGSKRRNFVRRLPTSDTDMNVSFLP